MFQKIRMDAARAPRFWAELLFFLDVLLLSGAMVCIRMRF